MKKLARRGMNNKGFSLIELVIVVAIMAALIAILAPQYLKYVEKSRVSADETMADELLTAAKAAIADEDYDIVDGDGLSWAADGTLTITATGTDPNFEDAMIEYLGVTGTGDKIAEVKSKTYTDTTDERAPYAVTIDITAGKITVTGAWATT